MNLIRISCNKKLLRWTQRIRQTAHRAGQLWHVLYRVDLPPCAKRDRLTPWQLLPEAGIMHCFVQMNLTSPWMQILPFTGFGNRTHMKTLWFNFHFPSLIFSIAVNWKCSLPSNPHYTPRHPCPLWSLNTHRWGSLYQQITCRPSEPHPDTELLPAAALQAAADYPTQKAFQRHWSPKLCPPQKFSLYILI